VKLYDACGHLYNTKDDLEKVKSILSDNPSLINEGLDEDGRTVLYFSSCNNRPLVVSYLLEQQNIDVNETNKVMM
jgi:hypothetical protein